MLLKLLGGSQSRAFPLTNIASWIAALLVTFFFLKRSRRTVLITLLLLMCAPIFPYYFWPSAEMFLYALVTCGAVFLVNQQFKLSALFISVAGTLNATVMAFGFFVIILFVYQSVVVFKKVHDRFRPVIFVKENVKRTLLLAAC